MNSVTRYAYAKINLTLDVIGKREDGYHAVKMIMQTIALHDDVTVSITPDKKGDENNFWLQTNLPYLPTDGRNIAMRAAKLFYEKTGAENVGTRIQIEKRIPVAAGLAGGSTDAAAVLCALNDLHETKLSIDTLCEMGLSLGADVPYCLRGGTMLAEGMGEKLTPLPSLRACAVVLCKPSFSVSTASIYAKMNGGNVSPRPDTTGMIHALEQDDYAGVCHRLYNVMEPITGADRAEIEEIHKNLIALGADGAVMSGSGPTMYGLFSEDSTAQHAFNTLKNRFPDTHLTEILR